MVPRHKMFSYLPVPPVPPWLLVPLWRVPQLCLRQLGPETPPPWWRDEEGGSREGFKNPQLPGSLWPCCYQALERCNYSHSKRWRQILKCQCCGCPPSAGQWCRALLWVLCKLVPNSKEPGKTHPPMQSIRKR